MAIFCKIGLPGFIVSLAIAGALLIATFLSIAIIDMVSNDNSYIQCSIMTSGWTHLEFSTNIYSWTHISFG